MWGLYVDCVWAVCGLYVGCGMWYVVRGTSGGGDLVGLQIGRDPPPPVCAVWSLACAVCVVLCVL